jgi:FixJ family two-component response regulator
MPKTTGLDLARRLLTFDPDVRVLFMSGHAPSDFTRQDFAGCGFEILSKPFRPEGLLLAVRGAIDRAPNRSAPVNPVRPTVSL